MEEVRRAMRRAGWVGWEWLVRGVEMEGRGNGERGAYEAETKRAGPLKRKGMVLFRKGRVERRVGGVWRGFLGGGWVVRERRRMRGVVRRDRRRRHNTLSSNEGGMEKSIDKIRLMAARIMCRNISKQRRPEANDLSKRVRRNEGSDAWPPAAST